MDLKKKGTALQSSLGTAAPAPGTWAVFASRVTNMSWPPSSGKLVQSMLTRVLFYQGHMSDPLG